MKKTSILISGYSTDNVSVLAGSLSIEKAQLRYVDCVADCWFHSWRLKTSLGIDVETIPKVISKINFEN